MSSLTIEMWCKRHNFSRATYYSLKRQGQAPRTFSVGRIVRITEEADREWCRAREADSMKEKEQAEPASLGGCAA